MNVNNILNYKLVLYKIIVGGKEFNSHSFVPKNVDTVEWLTRYYDLLNQAGEDDVKNGKLEKFDKIKFYDDYVDVYDIRKGKEKNGKKKNKK